MIYCQGTFSKRWCNKGWPYYIVFGAQGWAGIKHSLKLCWWRLAINLLWNPYWDIFHLLHLKMRMEGIREAWLNLTKGTWTTNDRLIVFASYARSVSVACGSVDWLMCWESRGTDFILAQNGITFTIDLCLSLLSPKHCIDNSLWWINSNDGTIWANNCDADLPISWLLCIFKASAKQLHNWIAHKANALIWYFVFL